MDRITFLTGAGISTGAGIPDFRGPEGIWTKDPDAELTSTLSYYLGDAAIRRKAWQYRSQSRFWEAAPTRAHRAIAEFEQRTGRVRGIITQNVDGLHQLAGSRDALVHEVHGNVRTWRCEDCQQTGPMKDMIDRARAGEIEPRCLQCGGIIRATTILFGEMLDEAVLDAAIDAAEDCEVIIAVGTSLNVTPVASLFPLAVESGAVGYIVNAEPTPFDAWADDVLDGDIEDVLPPLLSTLS